MSSQAEALKKELENIQQQLKALREKVLIPFSFFFFLVLLYFSSRVFYCPYVLLDDNAGQDARKSIILRQHTTRQQELEAQLMCDSDSCFAAP